MPCFIASANGDPVLGPSACSRRRAAAPTRSRNAGSARRGGAPIVRSSSSAASSASSIPSGLLGHPERHELLPQLLELASAGLLLGQLAERDDRGGSPHDLAARDRRCPRRRARATCARRRGRTRRGTSARRARPAAGTTPATCSPSLGESGGRSGDALEVLPEGHGASLDSAAWPLSRSGTRPHATSSRRSARSYDRWSRLLSLGQDPRWRRFLVSRVECGPEGSVLDVATGTAAVAIELVRQKGCRVVGLDQSPEMLARRAGAGRSRGPVRPDHARRGRRGAASVSRRRVRRAHVHVPDPLRRGSGRDACRAGAGREARWDRRGARVRPAARRLAAALGALRPRRASRLRRA